MSTNILVPRNVFDQAMQIMNTVEIETDTANNTELRINLLGMPKNGLNTNKQHVVRIPEGTLELENGAFMHCPSVIEVHFPSSLTKISEFCFMDCPALTSVHFPENSDLKSIGEYAFGLCKRLGEVRIPENVDKISIGCFDGCRNLKKVHLPKNLVKIDDHAFSECLELTTLEFPSGLTSIGTKSFNNCLELSEVHIPEKVTSIGTRAFLFCLNLKTVKCLDSQFSIVMNAILELDNIVRLFAPGDPQIDMIEARPQTGGWPFPEDGNQWIHDEFVVELTGTIVTTTGDYVEVVFKIPLLRFKRDNTPIGFDPESQAREALFNEGVIDEDEKFDIYTEENLLLRDHHNQLLTQNINIPNFSKLFVVIRDEDSEPEEPEEPEEVN